MTEPQKGAQMAPRVDGRWAAYAEGRRGVSFDKQIVRDWLKAHWDGTGAPPSLPAEVVARTADRYRELVERLTGG